MLLIYKILFFMANGEINFFDELILLLVIFYFLFYFCDFRISLKVLLSIQSN